MAASWNCGPLHEGIRTECLDPRRLGSRYVMRAEDVRWSVAQALTPDVCFQAARILARITEMGRQAALTPCPQPGPLTDTAAMASCDPIAIAAAPKSAWP